ncbi:SMI1/KNR4 family protein [Nocardia sp. NPDC050793]|uniref:SMI1/KNR4 family protein n=1 Tax=Nocardia sp. NPDC050793 TaxID=3155159 RepID=UPI0033EA35AA
MIESVEQLGQLVSPPSKRRDIEWDAVERELGVELPADYKELIDTYGGGYWDEYLYVLEPGCPNNYYDLVGWKDWQAEVLEDLWQFEDKPAELQEDGARLLPWATTDNGEHLYWLIRPSQRPDDWTVMVNEARGERWEHFGHTCTQFLASALTGDIRSTLLSAHYFPRAAHTYKRLHPTDR